MSTYNRHPRSGTPTSSSVYCGTVPSKSRASGQSHVSTTTLRYSDPEGHRPPSDSAVRSLQFTRALSSNPPDHHLTGHGSTRSQPSPSLLPLNPAGQGRPARSPTHRQSSTRDPATTASGPASPAEGSLHRLSSMRIPPTRPPEHDPPASNRTHQSAKARLSLSADQIALLPSGRNSRFTEEMEAVSRFDDTDDESIAGARKLRVKRASRLAATGTGDEDNRSNAPPSTRKRVRYSFGLDLAKLNFLRKLGVRRSTQAARLSVSGPALVLDGWDSGIARTITRAQVEAQIGQTEKEVAAERQGSQGGEVPRRTGLVTSDLRIGWLARKKSGVSVTVKNGAVQCESNVSERENDNEDPTVATHMKTTPRPADGVRTVAVMHNSPHGSGDDGWNATATPVNISALASEILRRRRSHHYAAYSDGSERPTALQSPLRDSHVARGANDTYVIRTQVRRSIAELRKSCLAEIEEQDELAPREPRRARRDKELAEQRVAERIQLGQREEQQGPWWGKRPSTAWQLQPQTRTFRLMQQWRAAQERDRRQSRIPVPVPRQHADAEALTATTSDQRLSVLKAAKQQVFDHARLYDDCVVSLEPISLAPALETPRPPSRASRSPESARGYRTVSAASYGPAPGAADRGNARPPADNRGRSWLDLDYWATDDEPPPIPERSSRRVRFHIPCREDRPVIRPSTSPAASLSSSSSSDARPAFPSGGGGGHYGMPTTVYGHWVALHHELKARFDVNSVPTTGDVDPPMPRQDWADRTLMPEPLNLAGGGWRRPGDRIIEALRSPSPSEDGDGGDWRGGVGSALVAASLCSAGA